ncbi:hypothetical protein GPJ56_003063 [Histomonas meleagridis]|uniref:uncharacterized protein n=1 Tax=Histomonas meleagridis TaxID=135588 RepID=UPI00355ABC8F|nr:hypothetical protein GPJ56_003063 [Histomonas meleagridis]KAH0805163.1 hypothetical protein GO595_002108 [Histomonas meleagridis]
MKVLTQANEIITRLEEMIKEEEERGVGLKQKLEDIRKQNPQKSETGNNQISIGDEINLKIAAPTRNWNKVFLTNNNYNSFTDLVQATFGNQMKFGFRDESNGTVVYLRSDQDMKFMFTWYFAYKLSNVQIVPLKTEQVNFFSKFNFRKEVQTWKLDSSVFRCQIGESNDIPFIFLVIPPKNTRKEGIAYLESIFGKIKSLMFADNCEDIITIDSDDSWEYCIETGTTMATTGQYPRLIIETESN